MNPIAVWRTIVFWFCAMCLSFGQIPDNWYQAPAPTTNDLNSVLGTDRFLTVGNQSTVVTSSNGIDWGSVFAGNVGRNFDCIGSGSPYVLGGPGLIRYSQDGLNWANGFATLDISSEVLSIARLPVANYCLVWDTNANRSYTLSSWAGTDWKSNSLPTTNKLWAIANATTRGGLPLNGTVLVLVGDRGTILTSSNGTDWTQRQSGTTSTLRAAVNHQGRLFAGGDSGVVCVSSDGISWSIAAPRPFDIRGLASSGEAIVSVGSYSGSGRVQASADGIIWPAEALAFPNVLNAVTYASHCFVAVGGGGFVVKSSYAPDCVEDSWTKTTSGYWEEPFWSCSHLPTADQRSINFTNSGWKALAIGHSTTANFPESLTLAQLTIQAPSNSFNQLLLNYAGTNVPLNVSRLVVQGNASLASYYSALNAPFFYISGSPALFAEGSRLQAGYFSTQSGLAFSNSFISVDHLLAYTNTFVFQSGGEVNLAAAVMFAGSTFFLDQGSLCATQFCLQAYADFGTATIPDGTASFTQAGGRATFDRVSLGTLAGGDQWGEFVLSNGISSISQLMLYNGTFNQSAGTNGCRDMRIPESEYTWFLSPYYTRRADYFLSGGLLVSGSVTLGAAGNMTYSPRGNIYQSGGVHTSASIDLIGYYRGSISPGGHTYPVHSGFYFQTGGKLCSAWVGIPGGSFTLSGGICDIGELYLSHAGIFLLDGGDLVTSNTTTSSLFTQEAGTHAVKSLLLVQQGTYELESGALTAQDIQLDPNGELACEDGIITNLGTFTIRGGTFRAGNQNHQIGRLSVLNVTNCSCTLTSTAYLLDLAGSGPTVLHFLDSHDLSWSATLQIINWQPKGGDGDAHLLFFGTNSQALTTAQLANLIFRNPPGWPDGAYPARILQSGEVVPAIPPSLRAAAAGTPHGIVLSWAGDYTLVVATNVLGPYLAIPNVASPFTNPFTAPEQYFRLKLP